MLSSYLGCLPLSPVCCVDFAVILHYGLHLTTCGADTGLVTGGWEVLMREVRLALTLLHLQQQLVAVPSFGALHQAALDSLMLMKRYLGLPVRTCVCSVVLSASAETSVFPSSVFAKLSSVAVLYAVVASLLLCYRSPVPLLPLLPEPLASPLDHQSLTVA